MNKSFQAAFMLFIALGTTGCESLYRESIDRITLQHCLPTKIRAIPGAGNITVNVQARDKRDSQAPGLSPRWGKDQVGYGKNALGEVTNPTIVVTEPVELTLKKATQGELTARGFRIGENAQVLVTMDINVFFNDFRVSNWLLLVFQDSVAELNMTVTVNSANGNSRYSRQIISRGRANDKNATIALDRALNTGIRLLFDDRAFVSALMRGDQPSK